MKIYLVMRQYNSNIKPIHAYTNHTRAVLVSQDYQDKEPISYSPCRYYVEDIEVSE
jgi:hypothetical protein